MEKMMHLAAQYLAAAGISFLPKKADDSHTNLGLDIKNSRLQSRPLDKLSHALALNYESFALEWLEGTKFLEAYFLDGKTHAEVLVWLQDSSRRVTEEISYRYEFHYKLSYPVIDSFQFRLKDTDRLRQLLELRILAQRSLQSFLDAHELKSEIRIWPHHFDTGAFSTLNQDARMAIGLGLAIPDSVCPEHYFYMSAYKNGEPVIPSGFDALDSGSWIAKGFNGAILPARGADQAGLVEFYHQALLRLTGERPC